MAIPTTVCIPIVWMYVYLITVVYKWLEALSESHEVPCQLLSLLSYGYWASTNLIYENHQYHQQRQNPEVYFELVDWWSDFNIAIFLFLIQAIYLNVVLIQRVHDWFQCGYSLCMSILTLLWLIPIILILLAVIPYIHVYVSVTFWFAKHLLPYIYIWC